MSVVVPTRIDQTHTKPQMYVETALCVVGHISCRD